MYIWSTWPPHWFDALMSWDPGVHKLDGVLLPRDIEYTLSVNLKFLFPVSESPKVAWDWFETLHKKLRVMTHFGQQGVEDASGWQLSIPYIATGWNIGNNDTWFADGIQVGRNSLRHALHERSIPQLDRRNDALWQICVPPKTLRNWLQEAQLLALITDKNLGIVVVTREWYESKIQAFMDLEVRPGLPLFRLEPRGKAAFDEFLEGAVTHLENQLLRERRGGTEHLFLKPKRILRFWRSAYSNRAIPVFHGIPKIHKTPWKIRPIVPMHSYVTGPLARILHAMLLPVQRSFSWICESSRNLCAEVAEINRNIISPVRLHSGDVVSMYTNIKWEDFRHALQLILENGAWYNEQTRHWILNAAEYLWRSTLFQIGPNLVCQEDGVPMGLHCAPVFANLFMAFHEQQYLQRTPTIVLYRRYIDDIFVLDPTDDALPRLRVPGLAIQWLHSAHELSFLDVRFHTHPESAEVCFAPYNKALSHQQYLPWASSHPSSVKKGLIKGELCRIRAICYKESYFLTWKATFLLRLRARGWPIQALKSWSRQAQWRPYFPSSGLEARKQRDAIIAVSEYNPVWEKISSTAIWRNIRTAFVRFGPLNLPYPPHCIVAKRRTRSMWDLVRAVNRNILHKEIEEIDIEDLSVDMDTLNTSSLPFSSL
jgi:hypothetical protein